jgi:hypothetical protein
MTVALFVAQLEINRLRVDLRQPFQFRGCL